MFTRVVSAAGMAALLGLASGGPAQALTYAEPNPGCSTSDLTTSILCDGIFEGNDSNQDLSGLFSVDDWSEDLKIEGGSQFGSGGGLTIELGNPGGTSGTWEIVSGDFQDTLYMFVLKGGPTFSAYLMDTNETSGTWNTNGLLDGGGDVGPGLSHFTVYSGVGDAVQEVPLPAGAPLLLGALAVYGLLRRRRG